MNKIIYRNPNWHSFCLLEVEDRDKRTPLYVAVFFKNLAGIKVLIDAGADKARVKDKWTPLRWAVASNENPSVIRSLINAGAKLKTKDRDKRMPLHVAAEFSENPDVVKVLIDAGADPNARSRDGDTPLDLAEERDNRNAERVLRAAGARKVKKESGLGKTALALIGGAAITYAGKDAADQEAVTEAARQFMEGVLIEQPVGSGNINSAATPSQSYGGQAQDPMQQALQNLENVWGKISG